MNGGYTLTLNLELFGIERQNKKITPHPSRKRGQELGLDIEDGETG
jgi:hypothetical protein